MKRAGAGPDLARLGRRVMTIRVRRADAREASWPLSRHRQLQASTLPMAWDSHHRGRVARTRERHRPGRRRIPHNDCIVAWTPFRPFFLREAFAAGLPTVNRKGKLEVLW